MRNKIGNETQESVCANGDVGSTNRAGKFDVPYARAETALPNTQVNKGLIYCC